jgi:hypothetical protein
VRLALGRPAEENLASQEYAKAQTDYLKKQGFFRGYARTLVRGDGDFDHETISEIKARIASRPGYFDRE